MEQIEIAREWLSSTDGTTQAMVALLLAEQRRVLVETFNSDTSRNKDCAILSKIIE